MTGPVIRLLAASAGFVVPMLLGHGSALAADPTYWQDVRPLMRKHCTVCHSEKNVKEVDVSAGLALDSYEAIKKGGQVSIVTPGKGSESLLVTILRHPKPSRRMPLDAPPLDDATVAVLKKWVDAGIPEGTKPTQTEPAVIGSTPTRTRKLPVALLTKAILPKSVAKPGQTTPIELQLPIGPLAPITAVSFSPDGKVLAVGCYGRVVIWDLDRGVPSKVLTNVLGAVHDIRFQPDGKRMAVSGGQPSARGDIRLYEVADWKLLPPLGGHTDVVASIAFSPAGKLLASASFDKTVRIWDISSHEVLQIFTGHSDFVYSVAFAPDGSWFATASKDRSSRKVETKTGKSVLTFSGTEQEILAVAIRPDGQQVVTSGYESALFWWDAKSGDRIRRQTGHDVAVHEIAFAPTGDFAITAGADRTARLWKTKTGESMRVLPVGSMVYAVHCSPDGQRVATGSFDGITRIWDVSSGRLLVSLLQLPGEDTALGDWLALTPEGFLNCTPSLSVLEVWRSGGQILPASGIGKAVHKAEWIPRAIRGDKLPEPDFASLAPKP